MDTRHPQANNYIPTAPPMDDFQHITISYPTPQLIIFEMWNNIDVATKINNVAVSQ